jgi:hypothetical protein
MPWHRVELLDKHYSPLTLKTHVACVSNMCSGHHAAVTRASDCRDTSTQPTLSLATQMKSSKHPRQECWCAEACTVHCTAALQLHRHVLGTRPPLRARLIAAKGIGTQGLERRSVQRITPASQSTPYQAVAVQRTCKQPQTTRLSVFLQAISLVSQIVSLTNRTQHSTSKLLSQLLAPWHYWRKHTHA